MVIDGLRKNNHQYPFHLLVFLVSTRTYLLLNSKCLKVPKDIMPLIRIRKKERDKTNPKSNNKISNQIFSLKYIFLAEHIFGIYRFSIQSEKVLPSTWKNKLWCLFLILYNIGVYSYSFFLEISSIINGRISIIELATDIPCIIILTHYTVLLMTTTIFFNKDNKKIFAAIADVDRQLMIPNVEFYRKDITRTNKFLGLLILTHIIVCVTDVMVDDNLEISELTFLPLYLVQKLEDMLFCLLIEIIRNRLDMINEYIKKFINEKDKITVIFMPKEKNGVEMTNMIGRPSESNMKIRDLAVIYDIIGSICFVVNRIFNFQIFITLVSTFCYIVITIWTDIYYYRTPENNSGALLTVVIWCVTTLLTVAMMCFVCERLRSMRNITKILVNQIIMDYNLPKIMRVQAKAFMEVIEAWPLQILIYDMFSVDVSLMLKFISVSTTYLIVVIQISRFS